MSHKWSSPSSSSSWRGLFALLITVLLSVPIASASPPLQARQGQLQGAGFLPPCAKQCVYDAIAQHPKFGRCNGQLKCLCGENPEPYRELLWSCIDDQKICTPADHNNTEDAVIGVCDMPVPSSSSSTSPTLVVSASKSPSKTSTSQLTTAQPTKEGSKKTSRLSTATIAGISVGAVVLLGLIVVACFLLTIMRNRRKRREQIRSMVLEPTSPRGPGGEWKAHGVNNSGWASIDSVDSNSNAGLYYNPKDRLMPIVADIPTEKRGAPATNISPVSPVSPSDKSVAAADAAPPTQTKVIASRKIIENHHLQIDTPPSFSFTPATPAAYGSAEEPVSPVSPISDFNRAQLARASSLDSISSVNSCHGVLPGQAFTTDSCVRSISPPVEGSNRHTCSAPTMPRIQRDHTPEPSTPPPQYAPATPAPSDSGRSSRKSSAAAAAGGGMARTDSIAWRRELEEAAERALSRVVRSEQSIQEEGPGERPRKCSIPGLDRFARRASRDTRGDEDSSLANNGETGSSFWNRKGGRVSTPPRSPGFFNPGRRRDSGTTGSKRSSADVGTAV